MTTVIAESELGIVCDNDKCTTPAHYVITVKLGDRKVVLYCSQCTALLLQGATKTLERNGIQLHEYVETEHLLTGACVDA